MHFRGVNPPDFLEETDTRIVHSYIFEFIRIYSKVPYLFETRLKLETPIAGVVPIIPGGSPYDGQSEAIWQLARPLSFSVIIYEIL